jgi:hypothetical protein
MVALVSGPGAAACHISAVPAWALVRWRSVQDRPVPLTDRMGAFPPLLGPSELMKASISWLLPVVVRPETLTVAYLLGAGVAFDRQRQKRAIRAVTMLAAAGWAAVYVFRS